MPKSLWPKIANELRDRILSGELPPGTKLPPEEEIASTFRVSRPTAHRAMAELQRQGLVRRQRRWGTVVAQAPNERPSRVALIVDGFSPRHDFPQAELLWGMHEELTDRLPLTLWDCRGEPSREAELIRRARSEAAGIILYGTCDPANSSLIQQLADEGFPIVLIDRVPDGVRVHAVSTDNVGATRQSVAELIRRGHRQIGYLSFEKLGVSSLVERFEGYAQALAEAGIPLDPDRVRWFPPELEHGRAHLLARHTKDALFTLLKAEPGVTALFCTQDVLAACVLHATEALGVEVPGQLEVMTFNDWPAMLIHRPWQAHRLLQRKGETGRIAAARLRAMIEGERSEPEHVRVPADLVLADEWALDPAFAEARATD